MERPNYLETPNPFNLSAPPAWFRAQLRALDPDLVIFPSQEEGVYRIARRVPHGHVTRFTLRFVQRRPDTKTFIDHGLAPVTSLLPFVQWGPVVLRDLAEMDIQRFGGAEKVAERLEAHELEADRKQDLLIGDEAAARAAAFYRGEKWRQGQTIDVATSRRPVSSGRRRVPAYRPPNFTGGGAVFVGR